MNMPKFKKKDQRTELEKEIEEVEEVLRGMTINTDDYDMVLSKLERLYALNGRTNPVKELKRLDPNTIAVIIGGLIEIGLIMSYENLHVITTKGFSRVIRPKI